MTPLSLQRESLQPRVDGIQKNLQELQRWAELPLDVFSKPEVLDRVHHHLRLALEGVFNIASHILARIPGARETEYKRMAKKCGEIGIVEPEFAERSLVAMAGYRNRLTHFYADIQPAELYEILRGHLGDIETFLKSVKEIMQHPERLGLTIE